MPRLHDTFHQCLDRKDYFLSRELKEERDQQVELNRRLAESLQEITRLRGCLPICASCKRIRNENNSWTQIETYIRDHSEADFTHTICPDCRVDLYPELNPQNSQQT